MAASIYEGIHSDGVFFNSYNQFFSDIHLPSGPDADTHICNGFADDAARHRDMALTDNDEQHDWFSEPARINGRNVLQFLGYHLGLQISFLSTRIDFGGLGFSCIATYESILFTSEHIAHASDGLDWGGVERLGYHRILRWASLDRRVLGGRCHEESVTNVATVRNGTARLQS
jgi:hypothetical protein